MVVVIITRAHLLCPLMNYQSKGLLRLGFFAYVRCLRYFHVQSYILRNFLFSIQALLKCTPGEVDSNTLRSLNGLIARFKVFFKG